MFQRDTLSDWPINRDLPESQFCGFRENGERQCYDWEIRHWP